jgi:YD repeat-containing protein
MRQWKAVAFLACALLAAPLTARAQSHGTTAPPEERMVVSPGGVDMRSGRYAYNQTDLTIGGETGALALARTLAQAVTGHANPFGNFSHNWDVMIVEKRVDIFHNIFVHGYGTDYQLEVAFGGRSQSFRAYSNQTSNDLVSRAGYGVLTYTGTRANAAYTYTAGDGTIALFRAINSADCSTTYRCAYVSQITEPDGTVLNFEYDNTGGANTSRLRGVTSSRGYALLLEYSGPVVVKACVLNLTLQTKPASNVCPGSAQATATYGYTSFWGQSRLASAVDPANATWTFGYSGVPGNFAMTFTRPGQGSPWLTNNIWERVADGDGLTQEVVTSQGFADGTSYAYGYEFTPEVICQDPAPVPSIAGGSYTDSLGRTTQIVYAFPMVPFSPSLGHGDVGDCNGDDPPSLYVHQVTPGPVQIIDPLGRTTTIDYCDPGPMASLPPAWFNRCFVMPMPTSVTDPEGIRTNLVTDMVARNVLQRTQIAKPGSTQPGGGAWPNIVTSATFYCAPATLRYCNKPLTETDARGNVTTYTYDAAHGGMLTQTLPSAGGGAPQAQTRNAYAQRYAWISNGAGGYVQAATPVWVPVSTSLCRTSAATGNPASPCATAGDEVLTQFEYGPNSGPNNLLLRGQTVTSTDGGTATTLRTCYTYDSLGRKISETQPNGTTGLGSCP